MERGRSKRRTEADLDRLIADILRETLSRREALSPAEVATMRRRKFRLHVYLHGFEYHRVAAVVARSIWQEEEL
jgi:hypothetical protein